MKIWKKDPWLEPFGKVVERRNQRILLRKQEIAGYGRPLKDAVNGALYYCLHREGDDWVFREWAPCAVKIFLIGDFNGWRRSDEWALSPVGEGNWELRVPGDKVAHGDLYKWFVEWPGGGGERIPAYATRCVQDPDTKLFCAQVWAPGKPYRWRKKRGPKIDNPLIYEVHIGMSSEAEKVATFSEFREQVLPRVIETGYNTLQIMALQEHPYYGSFGYQVSNFFALSSRFGTPEEFKALVDAAHQAGIAVIMDVVHSHAVKNEVEGLSRLDGSYTTYFHEGPRGEHPAWGSRCFDYGKDETKHFLLSNCKFWMEEYRLDGFRFDGVTSMLYWDHGLGKDFGDYALYFNEGVDENAVTYLALANMLVHEIDPNAITIAEDVSGMAGLAAPFKRGGVGFDFRMSMGVADHWIKWIKERRDEDWSPGEIWWELTNKREDEKTISYAECHDQALVGDKTLIFRLIDKEMYFSMSKDSQNLVVDRGVALHKMIRLITAATAGDGYLNFMGNEFGHPEWIDFPREGNGWSYAHARRQWSLAEPDYLRYKYLRDFDKAMIRYLKKNAILDKKPVLLVADEEKKILIFSRNNSIFAFNFHPTGSFADYGFSAPAGTYRLVLSTDEARFDGFGRLKTGETHVSVPGKCPNGNPAFDDTLYLYLPGRCAMVYEKLR